MRKLMNTYLGESTIDIIKIETSVAYPGNYDRVSKYCCDDLAGGI